MPSTYTARLKLERQASGENSGNWGNLVNYVMNRVDCSVKGYQAADVAGNANVTLTSANSTSNTDDSSTDDQVHNAILEFTGALTANIHVFTDAVETKYTVFNNTSGSYTLTFANTGHAANGVALKQGTKTLVYSTGSAIADVMGDLGDINVTGIGNAGSSNYFTLPASDGSSGEVLTTDGSKNLTFAAAGMGSLADDATPQLGGDLDVVTYDIVSTSNRNIDIVPHGTGAVDVQGSMNSSLSSTGKAMILGF